MKRATDFFDRHAPLLFPLPAVLALLVLVVGPILANAFLSLYDYFIGGQANFIGLGNFTRAFEDPPLLERSQKHLLFHLTGRAHTARAGPGYRGSL